MGIQKAVFKILILAVMAVWVAVFTLPDDKLHVVMCDVGQGDAILIQKGTTQMLVDGGPDDSVLGCLSKHMPFYDHKIEVVVMTHPQADHLNGLIDVVQRYNVENFIKEPEGNETQGYGELMKEIRDKKLEIRDVYTGDEIKLGEIKFKVIWPTRRFVEGHLGTKTDLNSFAIVGMLSYGDFDVLLTADADQAVEPMQMETGLLRPVEVLKVPHHGSKTGMTVNWLERVRPKLATISVGKHNRYGHPTKEAIEMLKTIGVRVMRTDVDGEVEVVSDGKSYWVK